MEIKRETITIDLEDTSRLDPTVPKNPFVEFIPGDFNIWGNGFLRKVGMARSRKNVKVGISSLSMSDSLKLSDGCTLQDLFSLKIGDTTYPIDLLPQVFFMEKDGAPFQFYFYPEKIEDCNRRQYLRGGKDTENHFVRGTIYIANDKGAFIVEQDFIIFIEFKKLEPEFRIELSGPQKGRLKHSDVYGSIVKVGEVRVFNPRKFLRSPMVNFEGQVTVLDPNGRRMDDFRNDSGALCRRIFIKDIEGDTIKADNVISEAVLINGTNEYAPLRWEIFMNFHGILNPLTLQDKYTIMLDGHWALNYTPDTHIPIKESKVLVLMKETQGTELRVRTGNLSVSNGVRRILPKVEFIPGDSFRNEIEISISNIGSDRSRNGGLKVMAPKIASKLESNSVRLHNPNGREIKIQDTVTLEGDTMEDMRQNGYLIIPNGDRSERTLRLIFDPKEICSISRNGDYSFDALTELEIPYYENTNGEDWNEVECKTFKVILSRRYEMLPFPSWLGLDFGSSAIVSVWDGELLDLAARRREIFNTEPDKSKWETKDVESESASKFISSDMLLNIVTTPRDATPVSALCAEQPHNALYSQLGVCLSPTLQLMKSNYLRNLPCLKLLVGNSNLPENPDYEGYSYHRRDDEGNITETTIKDSRINSEPNSLSKINILFGEGYKIVFKHYLRSQISDIDKVNRLVLTYPNSYTPEHLRVLKGIAESTFPNLRPGQLRFVSESDAVAAYYMDHWQDYNKSSYMKRDENILVYDMGAGTLDVTYLTKKYSKETGKFTLEIKGKLGICKAGNYLDFVLAKIVAPNLAKTDRPVGLNAGTIVSDRITLKDSVRNILKPMLSGDPAAEYKFKDNTIRATSSIKVSDVLTNKLMTDYLMECTTHVVEKMKNYMGKEGFTVDTVILSGRSCRLKPLQQALRRAMRNIPGRGRDGASFLDLALEGQEDRQKTAVIEGAVIYADSYSDPDSKISIVSRRLYASFGVAYKTMFNKLTYVELANHSDMPLTTTNQSKKFNEITLTGMKHVREVILIQSFLSERDTLDRLNANDFEYLAKMASYKLDLFSGEDTLRMAIGVDRNNYVSLYVNGNSARGEALKGKDLNSELIRQSIWPASI